MALVTRHRDPGDAAIREALAGNLRRRTGYAKIFEATLAACHGGWISE
ncbi:MAG: hypothetical protein ACREH9_05755 [Pseudomonadota bacterium]